MANIAGLRDRVLAGSTLIVIGLTGGIASGKSTAARHLGERGATVIDADKLGHRAYDPGTPGFDKVVAAFGDGVVSDGQIDRRALGGKVFADPKQLKRLTDIVWPEILDLAKADIDAAKARGETIVVLEAAVLLEAGWEDEVDEVWVVAVEPEIAVERASARDGVDAAAVQARIDAQLSNAERMAKADTVIDNSGTEAMLLGALDREWQRLQTEEAT
ncbi:MAG: dephospho-CoA kinase [Gammaproteobacteria bacterium]|nr:dephospho-CoA kinase [Gammaproteobacteria bacterium]